jgi:hypothetical protein
VLVELQSKRQQVVSISATVEVEDRGGDQERQVEAKEVVCVHRAVAVVITGQAMEVDGVGVVGRSVVLWRRRSARAGRVCGR